MIENMSTQLTVFHCLCPLPASRKGLRLPLRSALFGEGGSDWRTCISNICVVCVKITSHGDVSFTLTKHMFLKLVFKIVHAYIL